MNKTDEMNFRHILLRNCEIRIICRHLLDFRIATQRMINHMSPFDAEQYISANRKIFEREEVLYYHLRRYLSTPVDLPNCLTSVKDCYIL